MDIERHLPRDHGSVRLRRLEHKDASRFAEGTRDPAVARYGHLPLPHYTTQIVRDQIEGEIAEGLASGSLAVLAVAGAESDDFLGSLVLFDITSTSAEVGFWLAPWARGRGAALGAVRAALTLAADLGLHEVTARTVPQNQAAQQALERAGMHRVGEPHREQAPSGEMVTLVHYRYRTSALRDGAALTP